MKSSTIQCDGGQECHRTIDGETTIEVCKLARAAGWKLNVAGEDFCADCSRPAAVRDRERWEQDERYWAERRERHQLIQEHVCPSCFAPPGSACRTNTGNKLSTEHAARIALVL